MPSAKGTKLRCALKHNAQKEVYKRRYIYLLYISERERERERESTKLFGTTK